MNTCAEIHVLDANNCTIKVLSINATYAKFERMCKSDKGGRALAYVTYRQVKNGDTRYCVAEIRYK